MSMRSVTATTNRIITLISQIREDRHLPPLVAGTKECNDTYKAVYQEIELGFEDLKEEAIRAIKVL